MTPELSIITCVYKSDKFLDEFYSKSLEAIHNCGFKNVEFIFVLDGHSDNSLEILLEKQKSNSSIKIIELSRNFGHHYAASAGLAESKGDLVFLIDCDLEISPRILEEFYAEMQTSKMDVIYGVQKNRKGKLLEKYLGGLFWKLFNQLSETKVPENIVTERLMNRNYVNSLTSLGDKNLFLAGMMYWVGFKQKGIYLEKKQREGKSTYSFFKRFSLLIQAITSFSEKPLIFIFQLGLIITAISLFTSGYFIVHKLLYPTKLLVGFSSTIASIFLSLGIIVSIVGLVGLYLSRIFRQVQNRPNFIIRKTYNK